MKNLLKFLVFFTGWMLSPFTWWNDAFVNIPLSYLIANMLYYATRLPFNQLMLWSFWFTNALGLYFMYFGGKKLIIPSKHKLRTTVYLIIFLVVYSSIMIYLDKKGKLFPLGEFFAKFYTLHK